MRRKYGMGGVYQRGAVWWFYWSDNGRQRFESSRSSSKPAAMAMLAERQSQVKTGRHLEHADRVTLGALLDGALEDYETNERRSMRKARTNAAILRAYFGDVPAQAISSADVRRFSKQERTRDLPAGSYRSNATINARLRLLKKALRLGVRDRRIAHHTSVPLLREPAPRKGFVHDETYDRLMAALPEHLRPVVAIAYETGWRRGVILDRTFDHFDLHRGKNGALRLEPGEGKTGEPVDFPVSAELSAMLKEQIRHAPTGCRWLCYRPDGRKVRDFRGAWATACQTAGVPGLMFHSLRRSAARNLDNAGVPQPVAQEAMGMRTDSVWRRYRIVSDRDRTAMADALDARNRKRHGTDAEARALQEALQSVESPATDEPSDGEAIH
ncbi:MAG: site-specific integrase [Candidatus Binatia bacterium]|nr:site-specific integrase [Candidatus Binatia bacterium]